MLVLTKHDNWFRRQKYTPHRLNKEWVVWDTEKKIRVHEPDTRNGCERWRDTQ